MKGDKAMTGRQENNLKNEKHLRDIVADSVLLQDYVNYVGDSITPLSKITYSNVIKHFLGYADSRGIQNNYENISKIDVFFINRYMNFVKYGVNGKELSASTRNAKLAAINSFFSFLVDAGYMDENPCSKIKKIKGSQEKDVVYIEDSIIEKMRDLIDKSDYPDGMKVRDKLILSIGLRTGLRETALTEINLEDIDWGQRKITVTEKGNVTRDVYVGENTLVEIREWLPYRERMLAGTPCSALFISARRKKRISADRVISIITKYSEMAGKRITPHKMRSTCAVNLYNKTGDIYLTATQLGHKNISNTRRYAKPTESRQRNAAFLLDNL